MTPWLIEQKGKLEIAEKKRAEIHKKIDATNCPDEFKILCSQLTAIDLKIEALKSLISGKWRISKPETYTIIPIK